MHAPAPTIAPDTWQRDSSRSSSDTAAHDRSDLPLEIRTCAQHVREAISLGRPVALACDASLEGVLAAVGIGYLAHVRDGQLRLLSRQEAQPQLGEQLILAPDASLDACVQFARRVMRGFGASVTRGCRKRSSSGCAPRCEGACLHRLVYACASDDASMPEVVHRYMRLGFAEGPRVRHLITDERVASFDGLARFVLNECEHTRQFARFVHRADGSFVAVVKPSANTVPLVAPYFVARMGTERFCLVDKCHGVAAFHDPAQRGYQIARLDAALASAISSTHDLADDEAYVQAMWRHFYADTGIPGRDRSQRGYDLRLHWMPLRLWDGLVELAPENEQKLMVPERYAGTGHDRVLPG